MQIFRHLQKADFFVTFIPIISVDYWHKLCVCVCVCVCVCS